MYIYISYTVSEVTSLHCKLQKATDILSEQLRSRENIDSWKAIRKKYRPWTGAVMTPLIGLINEPITLVPPLPL